jgi:RNA polymerase sigma-54 factor
VHVTTVSRAWTTNGFRPPAVSSRPEPSSVGGTVSAGGEELAWDAVRIKLHEIVDGENKQHPFSDDIFGQRVGQSMA